MEISVSYKTQVSTLKQLLDQDSKGLELCHQERAEEEASHKLKCIEAAGPLNESLGECVANLANYENQISALQKENKECEKNSKSTLELVDSEHKDEIVSLKAFYL